ncbi:MAG: DUF4838 domain-containing protein [Planctomycetia bacterium]|nr:DUF4838 domain-containing protein [Planctomycetia bacterium]
MKRLILFPLIWSASVVGSLSTADAAAPLILTEDGQPRATILLGAKPTGSAQLAAYELQHHLRKMSDATLPIIREPKSVQGPVIYVGDSLGARGLGYRAETFAEQEYVVKTTENSLLLLGFDRQEFGDVRYDDYSSVYAAASGPIGTCYAVHAFLEQTLGVRWYYPNEEIGVVIPTSATIVAKDLDIRRRPDAPIRSIYPLFCNSEHLYFSDWDQPQKFQSSWIDARTSLLYWIRNRAWGSTPHNANHSFHGYDEAFGQVHPEWFSTKSWDKMKDLLSARPGAYQTDIQPCLTAPGLLEEVVKTARDYFDGKPPAHPRLHAAATGNSFPVMLNDNTNMCGCASCTAQYRSDLGPDGSASHYAWSFVNRVAKEVGRTHPQAIISNCAYFNYTAPPKGLIFEPNVAVTFCKFYTGYADRNVQEQDYQRIAVYVHENKARSFTTWEYLLKPPITEGAFPCLVPHLHAEDVKRLSEIGGFRGGINQYLYLTAFHGDQPSGMAWASPVLDFMNVYWRLKLYDNFQLDIDQALDEYYATFFGPGAAAMKAFYSALEHRWMSLGGASDARASWGKLGTPEFLQEVAGFIRTARQTTEEGSQYRKRVELADAGIMQYLLTARSQYERSAASEFAPIGTAAVASVKIPASADGWANDATWTEALPNEIERMILNEPVSQRTIFKLAHDDQNLYLYARCLESQVQRMKAVTRDNDIGGFSDDSLEIFLDPAGRGESYYQLCINSLGAVYDALENPNAIGATATVTWNSGIKVRTAVGKDFWELRAALPFTNLTRKAPAAGSTWRFNLCRNRFAGGEAQPYSAWSPTLGGFRKPERFGVVTFNTPADRGRTLWNCDFSSTAFAAKASNPLIGWDGWYENTAYANRGWDKSWSVVERDGNRLAVCDINLTNPSTIVPMHAVRALRGVVSVEVDYRRLTTENQPTLLVTDANGKQLAYMYAWSAKSDLVAIEQAGRGQRQNFSGQDHGLRQLTAPGQWFGLRLVINTSEKLVTGYVRSGRGEWVRLNEKPLPYYDPEADGSQLFVGFGTYKLHDGARENNVLEMDNVRVVQMSHETGP